MTTTTTYDLAELTAYGNCGGCKGKWFRDRDGAWLLLRSGPPLLQAPRLDPGEILVSWMDREGSGNRYARAEGVADPLAHLRGHARRDYLAANLDAHALFPAAVPVMAGQVTLRYALAELDRERLVPVLAGEGVALAAASPGRTAPAASLALLERFAPLIVAHLAGTSVRCGIAKCKDDAVGMIASVPPLPACTRHLAEPIRAESVPDDAIPEPAMPAAWKPAPKRDTTTMDLRLSRGQPDYTQGEYAVGRKAPQLGRKGR